MEMQALMEAVMTVIIKRNKIIALLDFRKPKISKFLKQLSKSLFQKLAESIFKQINVICKVNKVCLTYVNILYFNCYFYVK